MTNYKATLLIDNQYARDNYSAWGTPEAANNPALMMDTVKSILHLQEWERRRKTGDKLHSYWVCDIPANTSPWDESFDDMLTKGAADLVVNYLQCSDCTFSHYVIVYQRADGQYELLNKSYSGYYRFADDWTEADDKDAMDEAQAARHIAEATGIAHWEEAN